MNERRKRGTRPQATVGSIFIFLVTVAPVVLTGVIKTPLQGIALVGTALCFSMLVWRVTTLWHEGVDAQLLIFTILSMIGFAIFIVSI
jgi:hypothetical protein